MDIKNLIKKIFSKDTYIKILNRDSTTGKFVSDEYVDENPSTTTTEKREDKKRK